MVKLVFHQPFFHHNTIEEFKQPFRVTPNKFKRGVNLNKFITYIIITFFIITTLCLIKKNNNYMKIYYLGNIKHNE